MNGGANTLFRASMLLLMLSCTVCTELDASESHSIKPFFNPKSDVPSALGSVLIRHNGRLSDKYQTFTSHKTFGQGNHERETNVRFGKVAVRGKFKKPVDKDEPRDAPRLPDTFERNQFTFTSPDSRGLVIQVKPFVRFRGTGRRRRRAVSYKVYVLEGNNIRHYRVEFPAGRIARATFNERRRVANCIRRRYLRNCIDRKPRRKAICTTRIVENCVPGFLVFEDASPATLGTIRSSPLPSPTATPTPSPAEVLTPSPAEFLTPSPAEFLTPSPAEFLTPSPAEFLSPSPA